MADEETAVAALKTGVRFKERHDPDDANFRLVEIRLPIHPDSHEIWQKLLPQIVDDPRHASYCILTFATAMLAGTKLIPEEIAMNLNALIAEEYGVKLVEIDGIYRPVDMQTDQPIKRRFDG